MATDYDAPRKNEEELSQNSIEELKAGDQNTMWEGPPPWQSCD